MVQSRLQAVALAASVAGIAVSVYLTAVHYSVSPLACPSGGTINCEAVLSSHYGVIAGTGIPTSVAGLAWFVVSAVLWSRNLPRAQLAWSAVGTVAVLYLVFIEIVLLGTICLWCTVAHVLVVVILLIAVYRR
ncbi:MAG: vitamin K epoxide reductase family protein [Candidatus Dormibacterales bacterium]